MAEILDVAARFHAALSKHNDKALAEMVEVYRKLWRRLEARFEFISRQILEARARGELPTIGMLARQARYDELLTQVEVELARFGARAASITQAQQEQGLQMGLEHSQALMEASLGPAPRAFVRAGYSVNWNRVPTESLENLVGFLSDGSPLAYKFSGMAPAVAQGVREIITSGLGMGWNPRLMNAAIRREFAGALSNSLVVCRTEAIRAYRTAAHENYRANSHILEGWIWSAHHSRRTCAACWGKDGSFHTLDETLVDHPSGRCAAIPKTKSWAELAPGLDLSGVEDTSAQPWKPEQYFKQLPEEDQRHVLGPRKYKLWRRNQIRFEDIPTVVPSPVWGDGIRVGSIAEIMERAQIRRQQ